MVKKILLISVFSLSCFEAFTQNVNDTANYPYWIEMMQDNSVNFYKTQRAFNIYWDGRKIEKGSGWKAFKRWEWLSEKLIDSLGNFPAYEMQFQDMLDKIKEDEKYWDVVNPGLGAGTVPCKTQGDWKSIGPLSLPVNNTGQMNGMGRLNAIALHPSDTNTFFVGSAAGGIWKTTNAGQTWSVNTDSLPTLGVSAIAINPSNPSIMYFGSGDRDAGDAVGYGVFKSTNGGATWTISNSGMGNRTVGKLIIDPNNTSVLLAACNGGIYRSTNSGASWSQTYSGGFFKDIIFKPNNSNVVYATSSGLLYRSLDNGQNWTNLTTGLPTTGVSRGVIEVSKLDNGLVYFWIANGSVHKGFYLSRDSGNTFRTQSTTPNIHDYSTTGSGTGGQAWYDMDMVSDPTNAGIIYCGGVNIFKSSDTGKTWTIAGYWVNQIHADQHELEACPITKRIFAANDGGFYMSRNKGVPWIPLKSGLGIAQIYKMDVSRSKKDIIINGYQDNGTGNYNNGWYTTYGGDGMDCEIDQTDYRYSYGELYYGSVFRVFNVNAQANIAYNGYIASGSDTINESGGWVTPITLKEGSGNTMYIGYKNIWRSNNIKAGTVQWKKISNNLGGTNTSNFTELENCIANTDILYASRSNGTFFRSDDVNATSPSWTSISQPVSGVVNAIETDPKNPNVVYIGIGARVYRSTNKGSSWTQVASNLSNNVSSILLDTSNVKKGIYVGTLGGGVWYTDTSIGVWRYFSKGLPNTVRVTDLEMYYEPNKDCKCNVLYGSTYNRGNWYTTIYHDGTKKPVALLENYDTVICKSGVLNFKDKSCYNPGRFKWAFSPSGVNFINGTDTSSASPSVSFSNAGKYQFKFMAENCIGIDTIQGLVIVGDTLKPACIPSTTNNISGLGIFSVELSTLSRTSTGRNPEGPYVDLSCSKVVKLKKGKTYTLKVLTGSVYTEQVKAFIDYNNNGTLNDAGELVYQPGSNVQTHIDSFTVPNTAVTDQILRMRIRSDYISTGTNPCSNLSYGQTEDYAIYIESDNLFPKFVSDVNTICQDKRVKFTDSTSGVGVNYAWNFGSGAIPSTATGNGPHFVSYASSGYKKVTLTVDSKVYTKDSAVLVYAAPDLSISFSKGDSGLCKSKSFTLRADDANSSGATYQWRLNSSNIVDSIFNVYRIGSANYSDSGMYSVVGSTAQCKDTAYQKIRVWYLPKSNFTINDSTQCENSNDFQFSDNSSIVSGSYRNQWWFGDNTTDTGYSIDHTYGNYGVFAVKLKSQSNNGCIDSIIKLVSVFENSQADFTINNSAQCFNSNIFNFSNTSVLNSTTYNSSWNFGDGSYSNLKNPGSKSYSSFSNSIKVKLINTTAQSCVDSIEKTITLYPNPVSGFSVNDSTQCLSGNSFQFTNSGSILSGSFNSIWIFGDGGSSVSSSPTYNYNLPGYFKVTQVLNSNNNCRDTSIQYVRVFYQPKAGFAINDSLQCLKGNRFDFTNTGTITQGTFSSKWNFGNGMTSTSNNSSLSYQKDSTFSVKLVLTSDNNCKDSISKAITVYPQISQEFSVDKDVQCYSGNSFIFNNLSTIKSGTMSHLWQFGDASSSTLSNPAPKKYGFYGDSFEVKLISTSNNGCIDTISRVIRLLSSPYASFDVNDSVQCFNGNLFSFVNSSTTDKGIYVSNWNFGDNITSNLNNVGHAYAQADSYYVKLVVTSSGICKDSIVRKMMVHPNPIAEYSINDSFQCIDGNKFDFIDLSYLKYGKKSTILWNFGDGTYGYGSPISHQYSGRATYTVHLLVVSDNQCRDTIMKNIEVFDSPIADFTLNDTFDCLKGNSFELNDKSSSWVAYSRTWFADGNSLNDTGSMVNYSFIDSGYKKFELIVSNEKLCADTISKSVFVAPQPVFDLIGDRGVCLNENISLSAVLSNANDYEWYFNNSEKSNGNQFSKLASSAGVFDIELRALNSYQCSDTIRDVIEVFKLPTPKIHLKEAMSSTGTSLDLTFSDSTGIPVSSRNWKFSNGMTGTSQSEIIILEDTGTIGVELTLTDTNNCIGTASFNRFFTIKNGYYIPNTFTPNNDQMNDEFKLEGFLKLKSFSMVIISRWGVVVFQSNDPEKGWDGTFKGDYVPNGVYPYVIELEDLSGNKVVKKGFINVSR